MPNRSSSNRWRKRQDSDPYVRRAQAEGWRSRAVFKLMELQEHDRLIKAGDTVLDLGAAPGAWSQFASRIVGPGGQVIAVDILEMEPLDNVVFIHGDFLEDRILGEIEINLENARLHLVMSDMAPNMSGNRSVDQPKAMHLAELALDAARRNLKPGGSFVVKLFHGEGFDEFVKDVRQDFDNVRVRKPAASRPRSRETYLMARNYRV
jgi:23S rRNA (uridine2552-2'-O)-methyltransferase